MSAYKSTVIQTVHYVEVPLSVATEGAEPFDKQANNWLQLAVNTHVFDFKNVEKIDDTFSDHFQKFKKAALTKNCNVISVNFRPSVLERLRLKGQENIFGYVTSIDSAQNKTTGDTSLEIKNWFIKYLVAASRDAMNIMFNTTVAADENYRESRKDFRPEQFYRISWVQISSANLTARLRLYFDKETLVALTKIPLQSSLVAIDDEITDSTAMELLNLIYGGAKSRINDDRGYNLPTAIPKLMNPEQAASERAQAFTSSNIVPFVTPVGAYYLEIDFGS